MALKLYGGFHGDEEKKALFQEFKERILNEEQSLKIQPSEIANLLNSIPFNARCEFAVNVIAESPNCPKIVQDLFEWCFQPNKEEQNQKEEKEEKEEGFVLVGCENEKYLNPERYPMIKVMVPILNKCGELGVKLFYEYVKTTSTAFRETMIGSMVHSRFFSDDELELAFRGGVESERRAVVSSCKKEGRRKEFVKRAIKNGLFPPELVFYSPSSFVQERLFSTDPKILGDFKKFGLQDWKSHSKVYISYLRHLFEQEGKDHLGKGDKLRFFESLVRTRVDGESALAVMKLCIEFRPLEVVPTAHKGVKEHLIKLSKNGLLEGEYEQTCLSFPGKILLHSLSGKEILSLLSEFVEKGEEGSYFRKGYENFCTSLLKLGVKKFRLSLLFGVFNLGLACFQQISPEKYWEMQLTDKQTKEKQAFKAFESFMNLSRVNWISLSRPTIFDWVQLHFRLLPTPQIMEKYPQKKEREIWDIWMNNCLSFFLPHLRKMAEKGVDSLKKSGLKEPRTAVTCYVGFVAILFEKAIEVLKAQGKNCQTATFLTHISTLLTTVSPILDNIPKQYLNFLTAKKEELHGVNALNNARKNGEELLRIGFEVLEKEMVFDPASPSYVSSSLLSTIKTKFVNLLMSPTISKFRGVAPQIFHFIEEIFTRADLTQTLKEGFVECVRDEKKTFAHFNVGLHHDFVTTAINFLKQLLLSCKGENKKEEGEEESKEEREILEKGWHLYKEKKFGKVLVQEQKNAFLNEVLTLGKVVFDIEKKVVLELGRELLEKKRFGNVVALFADWQILDEVLESVEEKERDVWLLSSGLVSSESPLVRKLLEESTSDKNGATRLENHQRLLQRSFKGGLSQLSPSLLYVQRRIKNEAGLYRPTVYSWISNNITQIVKTSLDDGAKALPHVKTITDVLVEMLRDDVSKRDSVAKNEFRRIGERIIKVVLEHSIENALLEMRELWVTCGVLLDWIVLKIIQGDQGWQKYIWPLNRDYSQQTFSRKHFIEEKEIAADLREALSPNFKNAENYFGEFRRKVYSIGLQVHCDASSLLTANQAFHLLTSSLRTVHKSQLDSSDPEYQNFMEVFPPLVEGKYFPVSPILLDRMLALLIFFRHFWCEIDPILDFWGCVLKGLEDGDEQHFEQCLKLFNQVKAIYPYNESIWFMIDPLEKMATALLWAAIRLKRPQESRNLLQLYLEVQKGKGKIVFSEGLKPRLKQFLVEHLSCPNYLADSSKDVEIVCNVIREVSEKEPSAIHYFASQIISMRDDLLSQFIGLPSSHFYGVFASGYDNEKPQNKKQAKAPFSLPGLTLAQVSTFNSKTMRAYTKICYNKAMTISNSASIRSMSVSNFVMSPGSSHNDVISLIKELSASIALGKEEAEKEKEREKEREKKKEKETKTETETETEKEKEEEKKETVVVDRSAELLLESVILSVFQTDAAWFVLEHLLSMEVIGGSNQRTTANILQNLKLWVPIEKIVAILKVLLKPKRRSVIRLFLHKQILRLLFEANHPDASALFFSEWNKRDDFGTHKDVQHECVNLCVGALVSRSPISEVAWEIVEEVAKDPTVDKETKSLLLLPTWNPTKQSEGIHSHQIPSIFKSFVTPQEGPVASSFSSVYQKMGPLAFFSADGFCVRFQGLMDSLVECERKREREGGEEVCLSVLGECKRFSFSDSVLGSMDDTAILELQQILFQQTIKKEGKEADINALPTDLNTTIPTAEQYQIHVTAGLFVNLSLQVLSKLVSEASQRERADTSIHKKLAESHPYAKQLQETFGILLSELARISPLQFEKRARIEMALRQLKSARAYFWNDRLFMTPFKKLMEFLKSSSGGVTALCQ